jgi:hypothetical protein
MNDKSINEVRVIIDFIAHGKEQFSEISDSSVGESIKTIDGGFLKISEEWWKFSLNHEAWPQNFHDREDFLLDSRTIGFRFGLLMSEVVCTFGKVSLRAASIR